MFKTTIFFAFILLCTNCLVLQGQNKNQPINKTPTAPEMVNWFLSTGNWETDPQIFVREFGTGKDTVITVHGGWGADHIGLLDVTRGLQEDFRFIFYDQRGSLRSPFPDSLITFDNHIEDLELLRKELGIKKMTIFGHSMGSVLASAYASAYPENIKRLVLMSPAYLKQPFPEKDQPIKHEAYLKSQAFQKRSEVNELVERYNLNRQASALNSKEQTIKSRINFARRMLYDVNKWYMLDNGKGLYKAQVYGLTEKTYPKDGWNYIEEFAKRNYSVVIIMGDHDWLDFDGLVLKEWLKEVPRIELEMVQMAGHLPWIDQPIAVQKLLSKHLKN